MTQEYSDEITFNLISSKQNYVGDFHLHNFYEIFFLLEGEIDFCVQHTFYHLTPGSLMLINDLEIHKAINGTELPYKRIYIHIPPSFFQKYKEENLNLAACFTDRMIGEKNLILLTENEQMYFTGQFQSMAHAMQKKQAGYHLLVDTYLTQLLFFVNNLFCSSVSAQTLQSEPIVKEIMEYIRTHLQEEISLTSLSDALSLSKYHLCHIFKEQTGTTIYNHFITTFKKLTGFTPKKYASLFR